MADAVLIGLAYMLVHYEPDLLAVVTPGQPATGAVGKNMTALL